MSNFRDIARGFDWQEYIQTNFEYKPAAGSELRVCCPACLETSYKCYVNTEKRVFHCKKCEFSSRNADVFDFVAKTENLTKGQATKRLFEQFKDYTPDVIWVDDAPVLKPKYQLKEAKLPSNTQTIFLGKVLRHESATPYLNYLLGRGLTAEEVRQASTLYCVKSPYGEEDVSKRVIWPVYGGDGVLVSWVSRDITDKSIQKYKNATNSDIGKALWPHVTPKTDMAVLVEGLLDSLAIRRLGYDVYCTFGKKISEAQVELLQSFGIKEVVLFWDKKDAFKSMKTAAEYLSSRFNTYVADLRAWPAEYDCGDFLKEKSLSPMIVAAITNSIHPSSVDYLDWILTLDE